MSSRLRREMRAAKLRETRPRSDFRSYVRISCQGVDTDAFTAAHPGLSDFRRGVMASMHAINRRVGWDSAPSKARRWAMCGRAGLEVVRECLHAGDGPSMYAPFTCDLRTCPECARKRSAAVAAKYGRVLHGAVLELPQELRKGKRWRLVTLTRKNPGGYDPERLRSQVRSTRLLARDLIRDLWLRPGGARRNAPGVGAVFGVEVAPPSERGAGGMVHVHALVYGHFVPVEELREKWAELCADGSFVVDIREVPVSVGDDPLAKLGDAVREVLKYATKPPEAAGMEHFLSLAAVEYAFDGVRRLAAYGIFYGRIKEFAGDELATAALDCPECGCPAHPGAFATPGYLREQFRRGFARWHPMYHDPPTEGASL